MYSFEEEIMFLVRIELHGAESDHPAYDHVHKAMEGIEFSRRLDSKSEYHLPRAEYVTYVKVSFTDVSPTTDPRKIYGWLVNAVHSNALNIEKEVREQLKLILAFDRANWKYSILVSEMLGAPVFSGLEPVGNIRGLL